MVSVIISLTPVILPTVEVFRAALNNALSPRGVMATTYENMVMEEQINREAKSKVEWGIQQAQCKDVMPSGGPIFALDSKEHVKLDGLRNKVADLCDLQPTPAPMVRPPRKVRPPR